MNYFKELECQSNLTRVDWKYEESEKDAKTFKFLAMIFVIVSTASGSPK
jgi:hypothetical protein